MDKELRQLQKLFSSEQVRVEKCGIGKVNAALGAQRMINEFQPDVIISSGCAGGHGEDIRIQDVERPSTTPPYMDRYRVVRPVSLLTLNCCTSQQTSNFQLQTTNFKSTLASSSQATGL